MLRCWFSFQSALKTLNMSEIPLFFSKIKKKLPVNRSPFITAHGRANPKSQSLATPSRSE